MEAAGLAVGVLGVAGLFTSCIEGFDIIVRAKDFGDGFDLHCTQVCIPPPDFVSVFGTLRPANSCGEQQLSLQRVRLALWGESLGLLPSSPDQTRQVPYNYAIDREDIKPCIVAALHQLQNQLSKADVITERYALESTSAADQAYEQEVTQTPRGMLVLRDSFQKFKERVRQNQKQKSVWKVTRWSIHDYAQFEALVDQIRKLLDGLESITNALGTLERQHQRLLEEVESVSDTHSLSLLQEVGSLDSAPAALKAVSETASIRLTILSGDSQSYHTANTRLTGHSSSNRVNLSLRLRKAMSKDPPKEGHSAIQLHDDIAVDSAQTEEHPVGDLSVSESAHDTPKAKMLDANDSIPQHQRWMSALLASQPDHGHVPVFSSDDINYGERIDYFKSSDDQIYRDKCGQLLSQADRGVSLAQRVFIELRNIHRAAIPFISAVSVGDSLEKILACIEGPPGTPYQGGVFWITVRIQESHPPAMRFHTRIYHPNIDHTGKICADYVGWWQSAQLLNRQSRSGPALWFSEHATNHYSLGALLVALCGLLASPNVEDPLVPEIAEKFVTDYDGYCSAARLYTQRYAASPRPADEELDFSHDTYATDESTHYEAPDFDLKSKATPSSNGHIMDAESSRRIDEDSLASTRRNPKEGSIHSVIEKASRVWLT
ncbi:ubiquitin-conjugating enzyme E2-16 kDa- variant 1 [Apiospora saccharicola]|uniref:Ubiquitin-conjugating enzyme E2-16 kDa- variant 1 n=1 Tax=Apiospora saccharicola TaxID=335842 RepID=A0ABR1V8C2_9PEZI